MSDYLNKLAQLGNELDKQGLIAEANSIDTVIGAIATSRKVLAQYQSGIGDSIRNQRCWSNCYRQKRATEPTKSAQEVWMTCWDEYKEAVKGKVESWNKYAETGFVPTEYDKRFVASITDKLASATETPHLGFLVVAEVEQESQEISEAMFLGAEVLAKTAAKLSNPSMASEMTLASLDMMKEADFMGVGRGISNLWGNMTGKNPTKNMQASQQFFNEMRSAIMNSLSGHPGIMDPSMAKQRTAIMAPVIEAFKQKAAKLPKALGVAKWQIERMVGNPTQMSQFIESVAQQMQQPQAQVPQQQQGQNNMVAPQNPAAAPQNNGGVPMSPQNANGGAAPTPQAPAGNPVSWAQQILQSDPAGGPTQLRKVINDLNMLLAPQPRPARPATP